MEDSRDILNMADPYDAYAFFVLCFTCSDCQADLPQDVGFDGCDDVCCRHISDKAKALGWYVPPPEGPEGRQAFDKCYCPACAIARGLMPFMWSSA